MSPTDIPYKSRRLPGVDRLLRGPHGHVPPPVRVHRAPPRAPPDRAFRCHGEPDDGVGRTADPRGIPVGHGAAVPDPRPGRRIQAIVPLDRDGDGRGRGRHGATEPVAKPVCGTPDRQREARMPGPFDHPQRAAFAAHSWLIPRLLSRFKDPPVDRQGHTGWSTRSAGRVRNGRFLAQGRRSASSLRTPRGLTTPARIRSIPLCGDVDAADIRIPCIGSLARSGGISIVTTAPMVDYKIHWLKMMSVPESRAVVGRHDGINGRDRSNTDRSALTCTQIYPKYGFWGSKWSNLRLQMHRLREDLQQEKLRRNIEQAQK